jgi:hypothetical protein
MAVVSKVVVQEAAILKNGNSNPFPPEPQDKITHQKPHLRLISLLPRQTRDNFFNRMA